MRDLVVSFVLAVKLASNCHPLIGFNRSEELTATRHPAAMRLRFIRSRRDSTAC
jgi:hypothetical protein